MDMRDVEFRALVLLLERSSTWAMDEVDGPNNIKYIRDIEREVLGRLHERGVISSR